MTTSVVVKARAWGATVVTRTATEGQEGHNIDEQTHELGSHEDRTFHIESGQKVTFEVSEPSTAPATDEPVDEVMTAQTDEAPVADQLDTAAAAATDPAPASTGKRRGFGSSDEA